MTAPSKNLMPEGTSVYVLVRITPSPKESEGEYRYLLRKENDSKYTYACQQLPEPGPHLVGDRFGISPDTIYVLS